MVSIDKFKNDIFHIGMKHKNKTVALISLGECVDSTKRTAFFRYAIVFSRNPTKEHLNTIDELRLYPAESLAYSNDVDGIKFTIERYATQKEFEINQNPFEFKQHSM